MTLKNKVIWITGASSGIGEALALACSKEGASLVLSSRRSEELERVKLLCSGNKENIFILPLDLNDTASIEEKKQKVLARFGRIDILINNGGISQRAFAKDTLIEVDRKVMETNYFGAIALTKAVLPSMISQKSGQLVVISSVMGRIGTPFRSAYAASKHALHGFFDCLRAEVWQDNIKVTIICPGYVQTNVSLNALDEKGDKFNRQGKGQSDGMDAGRFAAKAVKAIQCEREEVLIGGKEIVAVYLKRFFPRLLSKIVRKAQVT